MAEEKCDSDHAPELNQDDWEDVQENGTQDDSEPEKTDSKNHQQNQGNDLKDKEEKKLKTLTQDEIKKKDGEFDEDGFFILTEGGFYDPAGYHYNKDGKDAVGGYYNEKGQYVPPAVKGEKIEHKDKKKPLSRHLIEQLDGKYDRDGFYILKAGGFYDHDGYHFNKEGLDILGGRYNKKGNYVKGGKWSGKLAKKEIEKLKGNYDQDGFFLLDQGGFYDEQGVFFDKDGIDEVGGFYDEDGFYVKPEVKEEKEFRKGTFGGKNKEVMGYESDDFEEVEDPKAEMDAHIIPAQLYLKEQKIGSNHWLKIANMPSVYTEQKAKQFLHQQIKGFQYTRLEFIKKKYGQKLRWNGSIWIQTQHKATLNGLLALHFYQYPKYKIRSWLWDYEYDEGDGPGPEQPPKKEQLMAAPRLKQQKSAPIQSNPDEVEPKPTVNLIEKQLAKEEWQETKQDEFLVIRRTRSKPTTSTPVE